jgi:5'-3' exonuclease
VNLGAAHSVARSGVVYHIDASYFIFRAYYSMPPDMVDEDGNSTHALYGFARFISDFMEQVRPERVGVAFDQSLRSETSRQGFIATHSRGRRVLGLQRQCPLPVS